MQYAQEQIEEIEDKRDDLEQYDRRSSLRVHMVKIHSSYKPVDTNAHSKQQRPNYDLPVVDVCNITHYRQ